MKFRHLYLRKPFFYCCWYSRNRGRCFLSLVISLLIVLCLWLGSQTWLLQRLGLSLGDEMEEGIPLESQGKLHMAEDRIVRDTHPIITSRSANSHSNTGRTELGRDTTPTSTCTLTSLTLLFVIRIPKCASTSFTQLLYRLSQHSNFSLHFDPSGAYNWDHEEANDVASKCVKKQRHGARHVYIRHFYYMDFSGYSVSAYSYVTLIREPVERFVSSYVYYHFSTKRHIQQKLDPAHRGEDLLTCLQLQHEGCTHNLLTKYFCGHDPWCKNGDHRALTRAKENLRNRFALVGVLEKMKLSLTLLQLLLPQFFTAKTPSLPPALSLPLSLSPSQPASMGVTGELSLPATNKNWLKRNISEAEREMVIEANTADLELYWYALEQLQDKARLCGISAPQE